MDKKIEQLKILEEMNKNTDEQISNRNKTTDLINTLSEDVGNEELKKEIKELEEENRNLSDRSNKLFSKY